MQMNKHRSERSREAKKYHIQNHATVCVCVRVRVRVCVCVCGIAITVQSMQSRT